MSVKNLFIMLFSWQSVSDAQLHVHLLHQSHKSSATAVICLTTLRRKLMLCVCSSLFCHFCWLCVLAYLNSSCHLLFLLRMWRECPWLSFLITKMLSSERNCPYLCSQLPTLSQSHANRLHWAVFSVQSASTMPQCPSTYNWPILQISLGTQSLEQIGGIDKWREY